ncbi:MAG TPA: CAP domain-containing protein, partial [Blastocatellia bacterium]|nr:CAP domain-containing protein [Blastocatellia bacterium]
MLRIRSYYSVCIAVVVVALLLPLTAFSQQSSLAPASQPRSGQLGTRHNRAPESRDSGRAASDDDAREPSSNHALREIAALEQKCLDEVNRLRRAHGLSRLHLDEELLEVARAYSRRMAEERFFAHEDPEGRTVRQRVELAGIRWRLVGENLAFSNGYNNPVAASLRGWME